MTALPCLRALSFNYANFGTANLIATARRDAWLKQLFCCSFAGASLVWLARYDSLCRPAFTLPPAVPCKTGIGTAGRAEQLSAPPQRGRMMAQADANTELFCTNLEVFVLGTTFAVTKPPGLARHSVPICLVSFFHRLWGAWWRQPVRP